MVSTQPVRAIEWRLGSRIEKDLYMKNALFDLFASKKFLVALTAIIVYIAGRFGFDVDTTVLDRIYAALLVFIGAQGIADNGKSAAQIAASAAAATASTSPTTTAAAPRLAGAGLTGAA
ncbi:MAG TPA: hypothetical protein VHW23_30995 [Kofleriaceae bacterium]|nr:hypothetical protein [Kofleriaceae bacterium]